MCLYHENGVPVAIKFLYCRATVRSYLSTKAVTEVIYVRVVTSDLLKMQIYMYLKPCVLPFVLMVPCFPIFQETEGFLPLLTLLIESVADIEKELVLQH